MTDKYFMFPGLFLILIAFILALTLVVITVPPIIKVAVAKKLFDESNERKIHKRSMPVFGGVAIFIGFTISTLVSTNGYTIDSLKYILGAIIILFFTGLKDDILIISANKKFVIQLAAALMLIILGNIRITDFQLVFRVQEVNYLVSVFISLLLIMATINAYNFIDGIDGLASGLGILSSSVFGTWFYLTGEIPYAILSFALSGSLMGFFFFNISGNKNKLFMGDAGSLIIGLVSSVMVIKFVEMNINQDIPYSIFAAPAVAFAILAVPLFDLTRVFVIRLIHKKSPFFADKNHIHHKLLKLIPSHIVISMLIILVNFSIIIFSLYLSHLRVPVNIHLLILLLLAIFFSLLPDILVHFYRNKSNPLKRFYFHKRNAL